MPLTEKKKQIMQEGGFLPTLLDPILVTVIPPLAKKLIGTFTWLWPD